MTKHKFNHSGQLRHGRHSKREYLHFSITDEVINHNMFILEHASNSTPDP